jgi:hypothetical protein
MVVGLWYMSISILSGCRISSRSRKLMLYLCSCDGVNCRLGYVLLVCWWIVVCVDHSLGGYCPGYGLRTTQSRV